MDIRISGHQMDTGAALQDHAAERLNGIVDKYFNKALSSHITFSKAPAGAFGCDIITHVMQGVIVKSHGQAHDAHQALDQAAAKIDTQLRRYKRRLNDHHEQSARASKEEEAAYRIFASQEPEIAEVPDAPLIVAETKVDIPDASVADAVMMLDLRHTNAMLFKNAGTGRHNMVYRRHDGSIGWVEPH